MGNNCCVSYKITLPCCIKLDATQNQGKVIKIVKPDGKVLEFTKPILVKDLLVDFTGFIIGSSQDHGSAHLPLNFELKIGQVYYMIPSPKSPPLLADSLIEDSEKKSRSTKRVRIVLTKTELKLFLAEQVSMEELIMQQLERSGLGCDVETSAAWKPVLAAIPEE